MKLRILTAVVGIPLLLFLILYPPLWVFGLAVGAVCAISAWELMRAALGKTPRRIYVSAMISAFCMPVLFSLGWELRNGVGIMLFLFFVLSLELMFTFSQRRITLEMVAISMLAGAVLPMMLSTVVRIGSDDLAGRCRMLLPLVVSFGSDAGAFFVGRKWGKRKLAPHISPNKTLEGAVGGIVSGALCSLIYGLILMAFGLVSHLFSLFFFGLVGGLLAELGDLTFSAFKRQYGIKDYSELLPGHGGMLDRFDSLYYLAPLAELWFVWFPVIGL